MTLFKQIAIAMSVLVIALLAVTMYSSYKTNIEFIEDRLYTSAKNTASSLGLAISRASDGRDSAMAETMINAVFDSGLYEAIVFTDVDGNVIYERHIPMTIGNVPAWFASAITLPPAVAVVPVGRDWMMVGDLRIEGHRGNAYIQMWDAFKKVMISFLVLSIGAMLGIYFMLKIVLRSLQKVREQAEAVSGNRFIIQKDLPHTTEFRDVVAAMNSLIVKVKDIYKQEADAISRYNALLYEDQQTHLKNRDFFMMKLRSMLDAEDRYSEGFVGVIQLQDPDEYKNEHGGFALQKQLIRISDAARSVINVLQEGFACRVREYDIMLILPAIEETEVFDALQTLQRDCDVDGCGIKVAAVAYHGSESISDVLAHLDYALMNVEAPELGKPYIFRPERSDVPAWGHDEWRQQLLTALDQDRFVPFYQPVMDRRGGLVQRELLLRLKEGNDYLSAGVFIPVAMHLNLMEKIDRHVLERESRLQHPTEIAVNVSSDFIQQSGSMHWLSSRMDEWKALGVKLAMEVPHSTVLADPDAAEAFSTFVQSLGFRFGIDHFMIDEEGLQHLQRVKPSYLKINAGYLLSLLDSEGASKRSSALFTVARILDIDLIAAGVDSKETAERLYENGIVMLQGYWVGQPTEEQA